MMEFGKSLRIAREAKGYTVAQLADMTRLAPSMVEDLEKEDFSHIAAPIYGRGFVKLYCSAVGLEAKPFVDEFMDILNGNREPHIRERPLSPSATAESAPEPISAPDPVSEPTQEAIQPPPPDPEPSLFSAIPETTSQPEEIEEPPIQKPLSRYASPYRENGHASVLQIPAIGRIAVLALAALVALTLVVLGLRALYRATSTSEAPAATAKTEAPARASEAPKPERLAAPQKTRTPQEISALYVD